MTKLLSALLLSSCLVTRVSLACEPLGVEYFHLGSVSAAPHHPATQGALLLMGGGDRSFAALRWFFAHAGHGKIVVLSASYGQEIGEQFYQDIGGISAVDTLVFRDRTAAYDACVIDLISHADGIFIAGGDQARYIRYWKNTPVSALLDAHVRAGRPLAGTSAGLAMLGEVVYGALDDGSLTSSEAIAAPTGPATTLTSDFLHLDLLQHVITDTHFKERDRFGRLLAFISKYQHTDTLVHTPLHGLGVDEAAAVGVDAQGVARVFTEHAKAGAWWVESVQWHEDASHSLNGAVARVAHLGVHSTLNLPAGRVSQPLEWLTFTVTHDQVVMTPSKAAE
jgi:cyanophycinase